MEPDRAGAPSGCAIVLAAGAGRRAGGPKAEYVAAGQRLVDRAVRTARAGGCDLVLAVVRAGTEVPNAQIVVNPDPDRGLASSLVLGLDAAGESAAEFVIVLLVDQPSISAAAVARMATARAPRTDHEIHETTAGGHVWFTTYAGIRDHPVRIDRPLWAAVAGRAGGEVGAKAFARARPERVVEIACDDVGSADDLDTPAALQSWRPRRE